jgi:hypothetical protein
MAVHVKHSWNLRTRAPCPLYRLPIAPYRLRQTTNKGEATRAGKTNGMAHCRRTDRRKGRRLMDRFLICAAFHIIASRHHGGQWSKGYAKLSQLARIGYSPGLGSWEKQRGSEERAAAARLLSKRRREIRLQW